MNKIPFRDHHLFLLLSSYDQQSLPLDLFISHYFRSNPALGSKDRSAISEMAYALIRWKGLLDYLSQNSPSWEKRCEIYQKLDLEKCLNDPEIPLYHRVSFPKPLFDLIRESYQEEEAFKICLECNEPAPTTIRVNLSKISREQLFAQWKDQYEISLTRQSPLGITFNKRMNFFHLPEYKQGFFEVQDEGSQLLAQLVQPQPGDSVLDYCAGSGGKTLAFAPSMQSKGQIYLHDVRPSILDEARKRLKRAGIQNAQIVLPTSPNLSKLKKKMDWVLVDAPCSGTGTLRRNPDMKWRFDTEAFLSLLGQQRVIFEKALSYLKPKGRIVYGTCSILKQENQEQMEHFLKTYSLEIEGSPLTILPKKNGMDGFFGVVLKRKADYSFPRLIE